MGEAAAGRRGAEALAPAIASSDDVAQLAALGLVAAEVDEAHHLAVADRDQADEA